MVPIGMSIQLAKQVRRTRGPEQVEFIILRETLVHQGFLRGGKDNRSRRPGRVVLHPRKRTITVFPFSSRRVSSWSFRAFTMEESEAWP